ncbi:MAG: GNAT family N-acetyltransferase [Pyrinomonadaceae bacterium]
MNKIKVQSALETDVSQIVQFLREFAEFENLSEFCEVTEEKLRDAMFGEKSCVEGLMAFDAQNKAVGYALFYENFASFRGQRGIHLEDLYVVPEMRKAGVGLAMFKHLANIARARGAERMDWQVLNWNEPAIRFYKKLGAQIDADERHFKLVGTDFENLTNVDSRFSD